ncbi:hypothetical protein [Asticcacaulis endophyticus]|nr:hypothetical protein [Asticcacaulis endophyticus]
MNKFSMRHDKVTKSVAYETTERIILNDPFYQFMDFIENFLRSVGTEIGGGAIRYFFSELHPQWRILYEGEESTFYFSINDAEIKNLQNTYAILLENKIDGSLKHLVNATEQYNSQKWNDSIRESVHAVESVCKRITDNPKATLQDALKALESKEIYIHPALKTGLEKIYAYTSDEKGIRHALLDENHKCDQADAQFMLGACASFISYLCQKAEIA